MKTCKLNWLQNWMPPGFLKINKMAARKTTAKKIDWLNIAAIGAVVVALLFIVKRVAENIKAKKAIQQQPGETPGVPSVPGNTGVNPVNMGLNLRNGSRGQEVSILQTLLNGDGANPPLVVDGIFGAKTEAALFKIKGVKEIRLKDYTSTKK